MAKKPKKKTTYDNVQFRPGPVLGELISVAAAELDLSPGEVAKRMTSLGLRGFDMRFYPVVEALTAHVYHSSSFDEAADQIHVAVMLVEREKGEMPSEQKLEIAQAHLANVRMLRGVEEVAEQQRIRIVIHRE